MAKSTVKAVKNASFRPVKEFLEENSLVTQLEYSDASNFESIFINVALTPIKHDNGIVLLINCSKVRGVAIDFELDKDFENIPKSMCLLLHSKPYKAWKWNKELSKSEQVEIPPSSFETNIIAFLEPKVGKVYSGNFFLNSEYLTEELIQREVFMGGTWEDEIDSFPHLHKAYLEYGTGKKSSSSFKGEYKTFQQKVDERIKVLAPLAWSLLYPDMALPSDADLTKVATQTLGEMSESQLKVIDLMLPKS